MVYEAFRQYGRPTFMEAVHIPWEGDILTSGLIFCFGILAISFYLIIPGVVGKEKAFALIRITFSLYIGAVILVSNFAMTWETAKTQTVTKYRSGSGQEVNVTVGVSIGFRGINITLKGEKDQINGETINYNENFNWEGLQGRQGFGLYAGQFNKQFRAAQLRGTPLPILRVAEYFTIDGEGIRWGRYYRLAGWYSHIVLWVAFPLWILANIFFFVLLRYGAYFLALTGLSMITSNIIWITMRNPTEVKIYFTSHDILEFSYGGAFWVCLGTGIACFILGAVIFLLDKLFPSYAATFFGVDVLQDSENIIVEESEEEPVTNLTERRIEAREDAVDGSSAATPQDTDSDKDEDDETQGLYLIPPPPIPRASPHPDPARPHVIRPRGQIKSFRTSESRLTAILQRPRRRNMQTRQYEQEVTDDYVNAPARRPGGSGQYMTFENRSESNDSILFQNVADANVTMTGYERR